MGLQDLFNYQYQCQIAQLIEHPTRDSVIICHCEHKFVTCTSMLPVNHVLPQKKWHIDCLIQNSMSNLGRQVSCFLYFVIDITVNYSVRIISKLLPSFMSNSIISIIMFICWGFFSQPEKQTLGEAQMNSIKLRNCKPEGIIQEDVTAM